MGMQLFLIIKEKVTRYINDDLGVHPDKEENEEEVKKRRGRNSTNRFGKTK